MRVTTAVFDAGSDTPRSRDDETDGRGTRPVVDIHDWNPARGHSTRLESVEPLPPDAPDDLSYEIDATGRLVAVSERWDEFAMANGAPDMRADRVLGRPFWGYFDDADGLVDEHRGILDRCRRRDQRGTFLLRCDSSAERRMLRMWITPLDEGRFRFTSRTLAVESIDPDIYARLTHLAPRTRIARCSNCNRFRLEENWCEPEDAILRELERPSVARHSGMIHTLCPQCRTSLRAVPRLMTYSAN